MRPRRQRGVALLTAILVVALAAVIVAGVLDQGNLALARTRNMVRVEQADALGLGLEEWAMQLLLRDLASDSALDTNGDLWASPLPPTAVPGGRVWGRMTDLNGRLHLNNLVSGSQVVASQMQRFERLLVALKLDPGIALAVADWLDPDFAAEAQGAEDQRYLQRSPPYRAANRAFVHVSELRLVRGIDREVYAALAPHVSALPAGSLTNVNTATVPVLMSLAEGMTETVAGRIARDGAARYASLSALQTELQQYGIPGLDTFQLGVASDHFLARAEIELDGIPIGYSSVIERRPGALRVVSRARGAW